MRLSSIVGLVDGKGEVICTGSIISSHHILSAAHCNERDEVISVTTLEINPNNRTSFEVYKKTMSPDYTIQSKWETNYNTDGNNLRNDLLVLELKEPLPSYMTPVKIAKTSLFRGSFEFSGAGSGYDPSKYFSLEKLVEQARKDQKILWGSGTLRTQNVKKELNIKIRNIFVTSIDKEFSLCKGDSGGAIYRASHDYLTVYGVVSRLNSAKDQRDDIWFTRCSRHAIFSSTLAINKFLNSLDLKY